MRVLAAVDRGDPYAEVSRLLFGVSLATIGRATRGANARDRGGGGGREALAGQDPKHLQERRGAARPVGATGGAPPRGDAGAPPRAVGRARRSGGQRGDDEPGDPPLRVDLQAKTVAASERDYEEARARGREGVAALDPRRLLVFVDECGSNVGLAPLRARAPKGERAHGKTPRNRGKNTTTLLLASMGAGGMCGAFPGRRGRYDQGGGVRGLRWAGLSPVALVWRGGRGDGQPLGAQGR